MVCERPGVGRAGMMMRPAWWYLWELCIDFFLARTESERRILMSLGLKMGVLDVVL